MYFLFIFLFLVSCGKPEVATDTVVSPAKPLVFDSCSQEIGHHPCNFTFKNQHDEEVSLSLAGKGSNTSVGNASGDTWKGKLSLASCKVAAW